MFAKIVNENAVSQMLSGALEFFASELAPTVDWVISFLVAARAGRAGPFRTIRC
jgi:hypothetical protein